MTEKELGKNNWRKASIPAAESKGDPDLISKSTCKYPLTGKTNNSTTRKEDIGGQEN